MDQSIEKKQDYIISESESEIVYRLQDGRECKTIALTGAAMKEAQRAVDGDTSAFMFALTALATTINGEKVVMEEIEALPLKQAMRVQEVFARLNF